jgi:hypothetical protein
MQICPFCDQRLSGRQCAECVQELQTQAQFDRWSGRVQQVLNKAQRQLEASLQQLRRAGDVDSLVVLRHFGDINARIARQLDSLGPGSSNLEPFYADVAELYTYLRRLHSLEGVPLPDPVARALSELQEAAGGMARYCTQPSRELLENVLSQISAARREVTSYLLEEA